MPELILPAELGEVELQLASHPLLIRYLEENVQFMVDILYIFQAGKGERFQLMQATYVIGAPKEHGIGFLAVTSGTPGFLEIGFGTFGDIAVHHETDIWLVYSHSEGIGADHHPDSIILPGGLALVPHLGREAGVVE